MEAKQRQVLSVSELSQLVKATLERAFPALWVAGEASDVSKPRSGHIYFTLKDANAQIRAVIWRSTAARLKFDLEDGTEVVCGGSIDVYPPRGAYQLIVREVEPRGVGALRLKLQQLQQRLAEEGLFDAEHKKPLPRFPRRLAFVTSPTGAAIRDFLEVLRRRWPGVEVLVIPTRVQGEGAAKEIVAGIETANRLSPGLDVLVVGRGGGSLEDLWCFNDEQVVRAIFASRIPVVSAVGHEIDVTLSDLVADVRALTPTEAAELAVPSSEELLQGLHTIRRRLATSLRASAANAKARFTALAGSRALRRPLDIVHDRSRLIDELEVRLRRTIEQEQIRSRDRIAHLAERLEALSPLAVLHRGYSVTESLDHGDVIRRADQLTPGDRILTRLANGKVVSQVESAEADDSSQD